MKKPMHYTRRNALKTFGAVAASLSFVGLVGCDGSEEESSVVSEDDSATDAGSEEETSTDETRIAWAAGGTDLITVDYPGNDLFEAASVCALSLTERTTEGPCYLGVSEREDISEGRTGLPMMLCLQLTDEECKPLEGYLVEVWHCDTEGLYSGDESESDDASTFAGDFCTNNDQEAESSIWFRGELTTDSSGRVNFKSCFPGWYSGRTIHIHFRVRQEYGGSDFVVSQICFDDDFCEEICTTHSLYSDRGTQDTPLSSGKDTVFPAQDYEDFIADFQQSSDGTLLVYKKIMISV